MANYVLGSCVPRGWLRWMGSPATRPMPALGSEHIWSMARHWLVECDLCFLAIPWGRRQRRGRRRLRYRRRPGLLRAWRRGRMRRGGGPGPWVRGGRLQRVNPDLIAEINNNQGND